MKISDIEKHHVSAACETVVKDGWPKNRNARFTFIFWEGHQLPAKYVLGVAYELATGERANPSEYTGGMESAGPLAALGFEVEYKGQRVLAEESAEAE